MERNKKTPLIFILLAHSLICCSSEREDCPSLPQKGLSCYNDYNNVITCEWNSTLASDHADTVCTLHADNLYPLRQFKNSCTLEPVDVSRPTLQKCSIVFKKTSVFQTEDEWLIDLSCNPAKEAFNISYKPACHIKLDPPTALTVNQTGNITTFSWLAQLPELDISSFSYQLQWKEAEKSWNEPRPPHTEKYGECEQDCKEVILDQFVRDEMYDVRVRVKPHNEEFYLSMWSDWNTKESWKSLIGKEKQPKPPSDVVRHVFSILACLTGVGLLLVLFKTDKTTWIYIVKKIVGPPLPDPGKSFLKNPSFQSWLGPHLSNECCHSPLKASEIVSVEITSSVDVVAPSGREMALLQKMRSESSYDSTSSSFSNPSYSHLSPPLPPLSSLTVGNLLPCDTDTPYGPVGNQSEGKNSEQERDEVSGRESMPLLFEGNNSSAPLPVISDYERVEKPQVERFRLQSLDSGMCSGEEVSQESLEADSINVTDSQDEDPEGGEETLKENGKETDFQKLFGGFGGISSHGSIQVCSGYEQVQRLQADSPELHSIDSVISSGGEEQEEDVGKPTKHASLLFPPPLPPSTAVGCSLPSFTPLPLNISGAALSSALQPLPIHILALMSTSMPVEPSGAGYMPVSQEQS